MPMTNRKTCQQTEDRWNQNGLRKTHCWVWYFSICCFCVCRISNCFTQQLVGMQFLSNQSTFRIHSSYLHLLRLIDLTTFSLFPSGCTCRQPLGEDATVFAHHNVSLFHFQMLQKELFFFFASAMVQKNTNNADCSAFLNSHFPRQISAEEVWETCKYL